MKNQNFKFLERTNKPSKRQTMGTDPSAMCDCEARHSNPFSKTLLSCEKKAKEKPKIDERTMFVGLSKPKRKVGKRKDQATKRGDEY
jgi:hypothetical protein|tara:strand:+ start:903 stop:1163 length:261 start_codon:yes stop_codon:yes gene_type:complete